MAANDLKVFSNTGLDDTATSVDTSTVGEPTTAVSGEQVFLTGNWFASRSSSSAWDRSSSLARFAGAPDHDFRSRGSPNTQVMATRSKRSAPA